MYVELLMSPVDSSFVESTTDPSIHYSKEKLLDYIEMAVHDPIPTPLS